VPEAVRKTRRSAGDEIPMQPLMDPGYNLREVAKQLVLLEDHLFQEAKRCPDCIRKHFLTVEALLEEAVTLGDADLAAQIPEVVEWIRELQGEWLDDVDPIEIAQGLRTLRKQLSEAVFDVRELQATEVATRHTAKAVYTGVILDDPGKLLSWWKRTVGIPLHSKVLAHHMTIKFRPSDDEVVDLPVGQSVGLKVVGYAEDDKGQAVLVKPQGVRSTKSVPHITVAVNGVSPAYSDNLVSVGFTAVNGPVLKGRVGFMSDKGQDEFDVDRLAASGRKELHLFDFDGTLFKSPGRPKWWGKKDWYVDQVSLSPPCVPLKPGGSWWNGKTVAAAKQSISDSDVWAICCTGRADGRFRWRIPELLKGAGLKFDAVYLNSSGDTASFKKKVIALLHAKHGFTAIHVWEDQNMAAYKSFVEKMGIAFGAHPADGAPHDVDCGPADFPSDADKVATRTFTDKWGEEYPDDGPHAKLMAQYMQPPDSKYRESVVEWDLIRDWAKKRRTSKHDLESLLLCFDNGTCNQILRGRPRDFKDLDLLAGRLGLKTATKSPAEREDEEIQRLIRKEPKKKPPRNDLRRERIRVEDDPDIEDLGQEGDKDISRNFKRVGSELVSSVIRLHHRQLVMNVVHRAVVHRAESHEEGDVWQPEGSNTWYGMNKEKATQGFEDKEKAEAFAKGGEGEGGEEDDSGQGDDSGPSEQEQAAVKQVDDAFAVAESLDDIDMPKDKADALLEAVGDLDEEGEKAMAAAYAAAKDSLATSGGLSVAEAKKALSKPDVSKDPKKLGEALARAEHAAKSGGTSQIGGPMSEPDDTSSPSPESLGRRTADSFERAKDMSTADRKAEAAVLAKEMKDLDENKGARYEEAKAALQGIQMAAIVDGTSDDDFPGDAPPAAFRNLVKVLASQPGGMDLLTAPAEKMYDSEHRALVQQAMNGLSDADFVEVLGGDKTGPGGVAGMLEDADDPSVRAQLREMAMEWHFDEASILPAIIKERDTTATPASVTESLREAEADQAELARRVEEMYESDGEEGVVRVVEEERRRQVEQLVGDDPTGPASANARAYIETGDHSDLLTGTDPPLPSPL
jgi:hypothetical protein